MLLIAGFAPLILALELDKSRYPWGSRVTLILLAVAAVALAMFVLVVLRAKNPILDLHLFANRVFGTAIPALFLLNMAFLSLVVFLPLFMVNVLGVSATRAGVSLIPVSIGLVTGSVVSGQLVSRIGRYRLSMLVGAAVFLVGAFLLSRMTTEVRYVTVALYMVICGLGLGPSLPLYTLAIQNAVDVRRIGQATSASQFFRQIGGTVGVAVMGTVLASMLALSFAQLGHVPGMDAMSGPFHSVEPLSTPPDTGELARQIRQEFDRQYALIETAILSGDPGKLQQLEENPLLPQPLRNRVRVLAGADAESLDPNRRAQVLAALRAAFTEEAGQLVEEVTLAVKKAFAEAVTRIYFYVIFIVAAALAMTFFIPELPLRRSNTPASPEV